MESKVIIDLDAIKHNVQEIKKQYPEYKYLFGVVKANAYGHGMYVVNALIEEKINYLAVSNLDEALEIRKYNKEIPILCLIPIPLEEVKKAIDNSITLTIHDIDYLKKLIAIESRKMKIHLKLDTGMNRLGIKTTKEVQEAMTLLENNPHLFLEGIYTHFATIGMYDPLWDQQVTKFKELTAKIDLTKIPIVHFGSSVLLLTHPKLDFVNDFRIGTLLYGYNVGPMLSSQGIKNKLRLQKLRYYQNKYSLSPFQLNVKLDLKPAMQFQSYVISVKDVFTNESIGYGATYTVKKPSKVAVIPVGYANGIGKNHGSRFVIINNQKYPVVGEIAMNMMMVLVDETVKMGDQVVLLGDKITIGMMSDFMHTTFVESLLQIGSNNKKEYREDGKVIYKERKVIYKEKRI